jgi:hypothetical protein
MATDTIKPGGPIRRFAKALVPWYDWGTVNTWRLDAATIDEEGYGEVGFFHLQWLGLNLKIEIGRTPKAVS